MALTNALGQLEKMALRMEQNATPAPPPPPRPASPPPTPPVQASMVHGFDLAQADTFDLITGQSGTQQRYAPRPDPTPSHRAEQEAPLVFPA